VGQEEYDLRDHRQGDEESDQAGEEGREFSKEISNPAARNRADGEHHYADRGRQRADGQIESDEHTHLHRVDPEVLRDANQDRSSQDHDRSALDEHAEQQKCNVEQEHDDVLVVTHGRKGRDYMSRNTLDGEHVGEGRDAPADYGPHKTIYNRFIRWSRLGVFNRILAEPAAQGGETDNLMIDAIHLKAHRTAASLLKSA